MEFKELIGKRLLGFMPLEKSEYPKGDWDNAIALYIGEATNPECFVLRTENKDYSMYDHWLLEKSEHIKRTDKYKAIGEKILAFDDNSKAIEKEWTDEKDQYWLFLKTKSKILRMGHHWYDCHYPKSLWDEQNKK